MALQSVGIAAVGVAVGLGDPLGYTETDGEAVAEGDVGCPAGVTSGAQAVRPAARRRAAATPANGRR